MWGKRMTLEWINGVAALALGLLLLGASPRFPFLKNTVDFLGQILSIPEYPVVMLREFCSEFYFWSLDRNKLRLNLEALQNENARLQIVSSVLLSEQIKAELASRTETARVTLREPLGWWSEFRIDKGHNDDIVIGLPVFQDGFLVGRVSSVSSFSSWVELLTSPSLMIPVVVEETRELGVVMGDGDGSVLLMYIPEGRGILSGMKVSTALVSELLPPGIPVGHIESEASVSENGYVTYKIKPGASLSALYTVSVFKYSKEMTR
ncbi:rod shape-determining protein MreC [Synergistales bacterium]|nr:rod shape-determining protein MreC [Synergistales bacterium]